MFQKKLEHYQAHVAAVRARPRYIPLVFSCFRVLHQVAAARLEHILRCAARRHSLGDHRLLRRRALGRICAAIWRQASAMFRCCLPWRSEEVPLLYGLAPDRAVAEPGLQTRNENEAQS